MKGKKKCSESGSFQTTSLSTGDRCGLGGGGHISTRINAMFSFKFIVGSEHFLCIW